jgi:predicted oxidoreductase
MMTETMTIARSRPFGASGPDVPTLAWGMWRFAGADLDTATRLVHAALDAGITLLDTADIYGFNGTGGFGDAEALLGQILNNDPGLRDRMTLVSKGGIRPPVPYDSSPTYLAQAIDASLDRLQTGHLDGWLIHRPDILTHPQEIVRALEDAITAGKIKTVGVSNFTIAQIDALSAFLGHPVAASQPELSPLCLTTIENGELDHAMRMGIAPMAWSPLGGGRIAAPQNDREHAVATALDRVASAQGVSRQAAAIAWVLAHPAAPIAIIGTQNPARIADAAKAWDVQWTRQSWYEVLVAARGVPLP